MLISARLFFAVLVSCSIAACSGDEFSSGSTGAGGSGGSTGSGGSGGLPGACPQAQPNAGSICTDEGLLCTYGMNARPNCRTHYRCDTGTWIKVREPQLAVCGALDDCNAVQGSHGAACVVAGVECSSSDRYCGCTCQPPTCTTKTWKCPTPPAPCPTFVPNAGTGCSSEGLSCTYGICDQDLKDQVTVTCTGGNWEWSDTSCLT